MPKRKPSRAADKLRPMVRQATCPGCGAETTVRGAEYALSAKRRGIEWFHNCDRCGAHFTYRVPNTALSGPEAAAGSGYARNSGSAGGES